MMIRCCIIVATARPLAFGRKGELILITISRRLLGGFLNWFSLPFLLFNPNHANSARLYTLFSRNICLSEKTLFLNLGFWATAQNYDDACYALAKILAEAAEICEGDTILDAGFGFADQDLYWAREFHPTRIVGLNVTKLQVEVATQRIREAGLLSRVCLINGSATSMPIANESVTKVVALESAFHFHTREQFFEEAFRVLKPGGRLATADVLFTPMVKGSGFKRRILNHLGHAVWQVPNANSDTVDSYAEKLFRAGFKDVHVHSIRDHVLLPFRSYVRNLIKSPRGATRMNRIMKELWKASTSEMKTGGALDYVLASARRP
jgi:ubiquinone/menaquinone biosynthesis C-methylase UbiE